MANVNIEGRSLIQLLNDLFENESAVQSHHTEIYVANETMKSIIDMVSYSDSYELPVDIFDKFKEI